MERSQTKGFHTTHPPSRPSPRLNLARNERSPAPPQLKSAPSSGILYRSSSTRGPEKIGPEALAQLQTPSADKSDVLNTELNLADDPDSWDVINPNTRTAEDWDRDFYSLEKRAEQLYSAAHLRLILEVSRSQDVISTENTKHE